MGGGARGGPAWRRSRWGQGGGATNWEWGGGQGEARGEPAWRRSRWGQGGGGTSWGRCWEFFVQRSPTGRPINYLRASCPQDLDSDECACKLGTHHAYMWIMCFVSWFRYAILTCPPHPTPLARHHLWSVALVKQVVLLQINSLSKLACTIMCAAAGSKWL